MGRRFRINDRARLAVHEAAHGQEPAGVTDGRVKWRREIVATEYSRDQTTARPRTRRGSLINRTHVDVDGAMTPEVHSRERRFLSALELQFFWFTTQDGLDGCHCRPQMMMG